MLAPIIHGEKGTHKDLLSGLVKDGYIRVRIDGEDYECTITLLKPIMVGATDEETETLNSCIEEIMDVWFEDVSGVVEEYSTLPKSVTFTSATLGTVKRTSIVINVSGSIKPKSGSTKSIKYKITYDREEENADIVKTS